MDFVWIAWNGGGNLPPQLALAQALTEAGHGVRAVVDEQAVEAVGEAGVPAEATTAHARPVGLKGQDLESWVYSHRMMGPTYNQDLLNAIDRWQPERLLIDGMLFDTQAEARATGLPYAALWHTLVDVAWGGPAAERLDEGNLEHHNTHREQLGLSAVATVRDTLLDADWFLAFSYQTLDSPDARSWPRRHYVGSPVPRWSPVDLTLPPGDDPLVVVAFSTTPMGQADALQRVADGLADLPVRTLITLGPAVGIDRLDLPRNAVAVPFVPHDQVLPEAALMVSHVGHGSMCAAARHGVPILAMPMGRDQDRNAEILSAHGIGTSLQPTASPREIAEAARSLLADATVWQRAAEMAQQVKASPGLEEAIRLLT